MRFISVVQGKPFDIVIEPDPENEGIFLLTVDGEKASTEVVELKPTSITMGINDRIGFYEYSRVRGRLAEVNLGYQSYEVQIKTPQQEQLEQLLAKFAKEGAGPSALKSIAAPMPGKILELYVKPGDKVELGNVVAVLEAMKMENEITSTVDGVVKALKVKPGDTVALDQELIEFE